VATSTRANLGDAISEVRDDLVRQLNDLKTRKEPKNNRSGRAT
jgi:ribosome-associated translation inhibitor RaiA